jgi:tetratricopeptide (TPR) repeat protein
MSLPVSDPILFAARTSAASGAWGDARAKLEFDEIGTSANSARSMLLADACLWTGDPQAASRWLEIAVPMFSRAGDRPSLRRAVNMQGAAAFAIGTIDVAADRFAAALDMALLDDDALLVARTTNNLGMILALRGQDDQAIAAYQRAIPTYHRLGNARGLAETWHNLAISYRNRGELDAGEDAERRAIEFATEANNPRLAAMAQVGRAEVALRRGDASWARAALLRAIAVFQSLPDYLIEADATWLLADAFEKLNQLAEADTMIALALQLSRAHEHRLQEARTLKMAAEIMLRRRDVQAARRIGSEAREAFARIGSVASADDMASWLASLDAK